jgi:tetratricopeptide (TPR) repeat protein
MFLNRQRLSIILVLGAARIAAAQTSVAAADLWQECLNQQSDQALSACTQIIEGKTEPGERLAHAYNMRALAYERMGQSDAAIADFSQSIQLMKQAGKSDWELAFIYFMRAKMHRAKGELDQAIADHTESIQVAPGWDKSYNARGAIYFQMGDFAHALDDISKVISFRPDSSRVAASYAIRALLLRRMGEPAKGLSDADRAIELDPNSALALYVRSVIYETLGRNDEATAGMRAALAIDSTIREQMEAMEGAGKH